jgi:hypothetical protein
MSMTRFQLEGLRLLGYTRRESEFLFLVATHSGYFTNRQFKSFARTESGSVSHAFIRKLLDRKHASYHAYRSGGRVYHVFARKVYQAIERENLRTRKKHELEYVKTRLVALDFVLRHPQHCYLETEAEKVAFFGNKHNLGLTALPVKQYRARKSADVTPRYFVDRFRVGLQPSLQRSRRLRPGLRNRILAEQPVWQGQGTILAAGLYEPRQVRYHPASGRLRLRHLVRCL